MIRSFGLIFHGYSQSKRLSLGARSASKEFWIVRRMDHRRINVNQRTRTNDSSGSGAHLHTVTESS